MTYSGGVLDVLKRLSIYSTEINEGGDFIRRGRKECGGMMLREGGEMIGAEGGGEMIYICE